MDVTKEADVAAMVAGCIDSYGRIDVLHNNVGIGTRDASAQRVEMPDFERIFAVNLQGPLLACKHAIPVMREQQSGSIINVSSVASVAGVTNMVAYKTSKAALNALTQSLALANARYNVRVNAILPGLINTPMAIEGLSVARGVSRERLIAERDRAVPMGHMGSAWDVASAAVFLASDESRFVTGVLLPVDGGQTLRVG
jgi:NAD(P)-dependent dehydrogenase (short-subunit alcohol dehydrogenase family)